jgi:MoaA/NifB/PqqE/SkfB family radical SAM enzyme
MVSDDSAPWRITFDTNPDDCNLNCIMCEEHSPFKKNKNSFMKRRMDIDVIRKTVAQLSKRGLIEIIPSTMGEPLLYRHFDEIIKIAHENGVMINLTTNGTWPGKGAEMWARKLCPVCSDIKISWNGATQETQESIMRGSNYYNGLEALRSFIKIRDHIANSGENRCRLTLQCTFMEENLIELPALVKLATELGIDRVKGHHIWVHYPETSNLDMRRSKESRLHWNEIIDKCVKVAERYNLPNGKMVILENFVHLPETKDSTLPTEWNCPFLGKEAWVNHEGRFDPCCAPDPERKKLGEFGFVTQKGGLESIWNSPKYTELAMRYKNHPVCEVCNMRRPATI